MNPPEWDRDPCCGTAPNCGTVSDESPARLSSRRYRYLGIEVDDAIAISEQVNSVRSGAATKCRSVADFAQSWGAILGQVLTDAVEKLGCGFVLAMIPFFQ